MSDVNLRVKDEVGGEAFEVLTDLRYICKATPLITESLQKGLDVTQMPNGDIIVTEIKTVNTQYSWDASKGKMVRLSQY